MADKEKIKEKLFEAYKSVDDYINECNHIWDKYNKMKEEELPYKTYLDKIRELNTIVREYENKLSKLEKSENNGKRVRRKSPFLEYILNEVNNDNYQVKTCPEGIPNIDNKPNTKEKAKTLQERLVQCCIDYILETGDNDIDVVSFRADALQESANYGKWEPCTDSSITIKSKVWDESINSVVEEVTGEYC